MLREIVGLMQYLLLVLNICWSFLLLNLADSISYWAVCSTELPALSFQDFFYFPFSPCYPPFSQFSHLSNKIKCRFLSLSSQLKQVKSRDLTFSLSSMSFPGVIQHAWALVPMKRKCVTVNVTGSRRLWLNSKSCLEMRWVFMFNLSRMPRRQCCRKHW